MKEFEKIRAWNALKEMTGKIYDYKTKCMYYKALLARACFEWGFNPEKPEQPVKNESVELNEWEKELIEDIHDSIVFGIDVRAKKRQKTDSKCYANMLDFVHKGGMWHDIPEHIRCESLKKMYNMCCNKEHAELMQLADYAINL